MEERNNKISIPTKILTINTFFSERVMFYESVSQINKLQMKNMPCD